MSKLEPLAVLLPTASPEMLLEQRGLRCGVLERMLAGLRSATTLDAALEAFSSHREALLELGRHDDAARLGAFTRAVAADVERFRSEAATLAAAAEGRR